MLHSEIGLFGRSSDSWDTDYARNFLQIPEEELKKLKSIPGWTIRKPINKKNISEQGKSFQIVEGLPTSQLEDPEQRIVGPRTIQNTNTSGALAKKSTLPPRKKSKTSPPASISLCSNNEVEGSSLVPIPKDCGSVPDIYMVEKTRPSPRKSSFKDISSNMPTEQSLPQSSKSLVGKLDTTYVIPSVLDDKTNDNQIFSDVPSKKNSSTVQIGTNKRTFESLETDSFDQPFLEESAPKFGGLPVFQTNTISTQVSHENFLSKKLRLLEKRFSPSKDFSLSPSQETMLAKVNLKRIESQVDLPKVVSKQIEDLNSQANIRSQVSAKVSLDSKDGNITEMSSSKKAATKEKDVVSEAELLEKEYVEVASTKSATNVFEEESFVSLPIPCGQPPSNDQPHSSIECQPSVNILMAEKGNMPSPALSEKCGSKVEVQELILKGSKVGRKRKLKSKGESTSRKPFGGNPIVIQYTVEQIRKMMEIMKNFQSEI